MKDCKEGYYESLNEKYRIYKMDKIHSTCRVTKYYQGVVLPEESSRYSSKQTTEQNIADVYSLGIVDETYGESQTSIKQWFEEAKWIGTIKGSMLGY